MNLKREIETELRLKKAVDPNPFTKRINQTDRSLVITSQRFIYLFLFHPRNYYKLSLCATYSVIYYYGSLEEHAQWLYEL